MKKTLYRLGLILCLLPSLAHSIQGVAEYVVDFDKVPALGLSATARALTPVSGAFPRGAVIWSDTLFVVERYITDDNSLGSTLVVNSTHCPGVILSGTSASTLNSNQVSAGAAEWYGDQGCAFGDDPGLSLTVSDGNITGGRFRMFVPWVAPFASIQPVRTETPQPTLTFTATFTATPTFSASPTATRTASPSPTTTPTPTNTPTP